MRGRLVQYRGEMLTLKELHCLTGLNRVQLEYYTSNGMNAEEAVEYMRKKDAAYDIGGEMLTVAQIAQRSGKMKISTVLKRLEAGETPEEIMASKRVERMAWPDKAFAMLYPAQDREAMRFRELSPGNWGWQTEHFCYMASRLGKQHMLLRAWWRGSGEAAMLRLYWLREQEGKDDVLAEIVPQEHKEAVLRRWGLV